MGSGGLGAGEGTGTEPAAGRTERQGSAGAGRHGASCAADNKGNTHAACLAVWVPEWPRHAPVASVPRVSCAATCPRVHVDCV
eukprot:7179076-Prymnesium_polylepis.1